MVKERVSPGLAVCGIYRFVVIGIDVEVRSGCHRCLCGVGVLRGSLVRIYGAGVVNYGAIIERRDDDRGEVHRTTSIHRYRSDIPGYGACPGII